MYFSRIQFHDSFLLLKSWLIRHIFAIFVINCQFFFLSHGMPKHAVTFSPPTQSSFELINATCSEHWQFNVLTLNRRSKIPIICLIWGIKSSYNHFRHHDHFLIVHVIKMLEILLSWLITRKSSSMH